jgi:hypothetical protein
MIVTPNTDNILVVVLLSMFLVPTGLTYHPLVLASFNRAFVFVVFVVRVIANAAGAFEAGAPRHNQRLDYLISIFALF